MATLPELTHCPRTHLCSFTHFLLLSLEETGQRGKQQ